MNVFRMLIGVNMVLPDTLILHLLRAVLSTFNGAQDKQDKLGARAAKEDERQEKVVENEGGTTSICGSACGGTAAPSPKVESAQHLGILACIPLNMYIYACLFYWRTYCATTNHDMCYYLHGRVG